MEIKEKMVVEKERIRQEEEKRKARILLRAKEKAEEMVMDTEKEMIRLGTTVGAKAQKVKAVVKVNGEKDGGDLTVGTITTTTIVRPTKPIK